MKLILEPTILQQHKISVNGTIKRVIELYRKLKIPMSALITDYYAAKDKYNELVEAENPWLHYHRGILKESVEAGASAMETAFIRGAMGLVNKKQIPTDVINAAFYTNRNRDDSAFELSYLLPLFFEGVDADENVLIVNPTPDIILMSQEMHDPEKLSYLVTDETIARLYKMQFPRSAFMPFEDYSPLCDMDRLLIINRDQSKDKASALIASINCCKDTAQILMFVPAAWFDRKKGCGYPLIQKSQFSASSMVIIDPTAVASSPRKKLLIELKSSPSDTFDLFSSTYNKVSREFVVLPEAKRINSDEYFLTDHSILSIWNQSDEPGNDTKEYRKPMVYEFSREIKLFYQIYRKGDTLYGSAYYREIKDIDHEYGSIEYGVRKSDRIEKGLRGESVEQIEVAMENIPYLPKICKVINDDLDEHYIQRRIPVSLKTLWYCVREQLLGLKKYNDELMKEMFSKDKKNIISYNVKEDDIEELLKAIADYLELKAEDIPYKYVEQMYMLFEAARKRGYIRRNPLEIYMPIYTRRATERQQETREALVKKQFTELEEKKIIKYAVEKMKYGEEYESRCIVQSIWLAGLIRMFTGMALKEVAALKWKDMIGIEGTDDYFFSVNKIWNEKGKVSIYTEKEKWNRYRRVPVTSFLRDILLKRKQFLKRQRYTENEIDDLPIIMQNEKKSEKVIHPSLCKPWKIRDACSELVKKADIPEELIVLPDDRNELVVDIYKYLGDIFRSNFAAKAKNNAGLELGELNYVLGIEAPDTFSKHYCDYANEIILYGIIRKLDRWASAYYPEIEHAKYAERINDSREGSFSITAGPFRKKNTVVELIINNTSSAVGELFVEAEHGVVVELSEYGGKHDDDADE